PISLFSHAQQRIHIGNNGIPLLHNDAHSPSCMPRHDCSIYQVLVASRARLRFSWDMQDQR
ncbi:unnamed protein product, partial [Musa acuminata subsp. burmannicoides]